MQPVVQEHREGCMLACAAMLANLTYGDVAVIAESLGEMVRKSRGLLELEAVVDAALRGSERAPTPEVA